MSDYFSTQTSLADRIAETYYGEYYVYVAEEFNPPKNDPSSNPKVISDQWCKVTSGKMVNSAEGDDLWFDHREKLKNIALRKAERKTISNRTKERIHQDIIRAEARDAAPIVYVIPKSQFPATRLLPGDTHDDYPDNVEYVISGLKKAD